jgi:hypothetical protein
MTCIDLPTCSTCASEPREDGGKISELLRASGPPPQPSLPAVRRAIIGRLFTQFVASLRCLHCGNQFLAPLDSKMPK